MSASEAVIYKLCLSQPWDSQDMAGCSIMHKFFQSEQPRQQGLKLTGHNPITLYGDWHSFLLMDTFKKFKPF